MNVRRFLIIVLLALPLTAACNDVRRDTRSPSTLQCRPVADLDRSGRLAMAANFPDSDITRAILILTSTPEEMPKIIAADPYVTDGHLTYEVHPWMTRHGVLRR